MKGVLRWAALIALLVGTPVAGAILARRSARAAQAQSRDAPVQTPLMERAREPEDLVGVLVPPRMANLSPTADGRILEVYVTLGQNVRAGDVLVSFDPRERRQALAMAHAELASVRAEVAAAHSELSATRRRSARRTATVDVGGKRVALVSGEEAAQAQADAQTSAAKVAAATARVAEQKAKVKQLRLALEEADLHAPFDGVITALNFGQGTRVQSSDVVARMVGGDGLRVRIAVPEEHPELVRLARARLTMDDNRVFLAILDQRATEVEPASRAFFVEGTVGGTPASCGGDCSLFAGRSVRVRLLNDTEP